MDFQFYFKKMNSSEALKNITMRKIRDRLDKYVDYSSKVHITFFAEGNLKHINCGVGATNGGNLHAEGASENIFSALDILTQKLESQLQRRKTKLKNRHKQRWNAEKIASLLSTRRPQPADDESLEVIDAVDIIKFEAATKPDRVRLMH